MTVIDTMPATGAAFRTWLCGQTELAALVGARIYLDGIPASAGYPLIGMSLIDAQDGVDVPFDFATFRLEVRGASRAAVDAITAVLRSVFRSVSARRTLLDASTRVHSIEFGGVLWQPDPHLQRNAARNIVTCTVQAIAV